MNSFHREGQIVRLTRAPNPVQAHIWENAVRDEGIHSHVVGDFLDVGIGDISGVQPEIWVKREDLAPAQAVLQRCSQSAGDISHEETVPGRERCDQA